MTDCLSTVVIVIVILLLFYTTCDCVGSESYSANYFGLRPGIPYIHKDKFSVNSTLDSIKASAARGFKKWKKDLYGKQSYQASQNGMAWGTPP